MTEVAPGEPEAPLRARNPAWVADELILAMDLYVRRGQLDAKQPDVVDLSRLLNALPLEVARPDRMRFRNSNSVAMKLANFAALDRPGHGLSSGGAGARRVWEGFTGRRGELHSLAEQLREGVTPGSKMHLPAGEVDDEEGVAEGRLLYRRHRARERDQGIVRRKKAIELKRLHRLACEVCGFDFHTTYGPAGEGYIEVHHILPLSKAGESVTKLKDLALVCANCHRMLHSRHGWVTPGDLRASIAGVVVSAPATGGMA